MDRWICYGISGISQPKVYLIFFVLPDLSISQQGWLPGQGIIDKLPTEHFCLGLQWKKSPTPMLPSGIYWASQKCSKFGGYICKKKKQKEGETYVQNKTISGTEGRMTSPG